MHRATLILAAIAIVSTNALTADAKNKGTLPKGSTPLSAEEAHKFYAGKTIDFKEYKYYFADDGTLYGVDSKKTIFSEGVWKVNGNEVCMDTTWRGKNRSDKPYLYIRCTKLYNSKGKIWNVMTKPNDQYVGNTDMEEAKKLRKGDRVSATVAKLKTAYGY